MQIPVEEDEIKDLPAINNILAVKVNEKYQIILVHQSG